mmetsp:Transcript_5043/g.15311  ORF Transcript_5043/g.15311 Transcript_5043/m.15311 type:complete len:257 (+) Transcript_5043:989-1759(+)
MRDEGQTPPASQASARVPKTTASFIQAIYVSPIEAAASDETLRNCRIRSCHLEPFHTFRVLPPQPFHTSTVLPHEPHGGPVPFWPVLGPPRAAFWDRDVRPPEGPSLGSTQGQAQTCISARVWAYEPTADPILASTMRQLATAPAAAAGCRRLVWVSVFARPSELAPSRQLRRVVTRPTRLQHRRRPSTPSARQPALAPSWYLAASCAASSPDPPACSTASSPAAHARVWGCWSPSAASSLGNASRYTPSASASFA